ncbi:glycerate kinase, partial [Planomonospora algeriensis]
GRRGQLRPAHRDQPRHRRAHRARRTARARRIVLGLGGSACTDGGTGMMAALGVRFLDANGRELPPGGAALRDLARIDTSGLMPLDGVEVVVACDVDNPLLGPYGAAAVYAPQKGATGEEVRLLEAALARLAAVAAHTHGLTGAIEHDGVVRPMGVAAQPGAGGGRRRGLRRRRLPAGRHPPRHRVPARPARLPAAA